MDINVLQKAVRNLPFEPFVLTMNDGREFAIHHPDWIFVRTNHVTIVDASRERAIQLEPLLIASLTVEFPPPADDEENAP